MKFFLRTSLALLLGAVLCVCGVMRIQAARDTSLHLMTSPMPVLITMKPGTSQKVDVRIKNTGNQTEEIKGSVMSFTASGETGKPQLIEGTEQDEFIKWVAFSEPVFTLSPNQWKTITATITAPAYAGNGYYYALVFRRNKEVYEKEQVQSQLSGGVATLILLDVSSPNAKRELSDLKFEVEKNLYEYLPATFKVRVHNSGNVHLAPVGSVFIDHTDQHDISILKVNNDKGYILPGTNREFKVAWSDGFPRYENVVENGTVALDDKGQPKQKLAWDFNKLSQFRIGRYKASLLMVFDDGTRDVPMTADVSFWVFPWKLILAAAAVALIVGFGLIGIVKGIWKRFRRTPAQP